MPAIPGFIDTLEYIKTLHKKKNDDYSGDKGAFFNFDFCEYISSLFSNNKDKVYAVFVGVKLARLAVVLSKPPSNESVEDTFNDLITYATIWKSDYMNRNRNLTFPAISEKIANKV